MVDGQKGKETRYLPPNGGRVTAKKGLPPSGNSPISNSTTQIPDVTFIPLSSDHRPVINIGPPPDSLTPIESDSYGERILRVDLESQIMANINDGLIVSQTEDSLVVDTRNYLVFCSNKTKTEDQDSSVSEDTLGIVIDQNGDVLIVVADGVGGSAYGSYTSRRTVAAQVTRGSSTLDLDQLSTAASAGWPEFSTNVLKKFQAAHSNSPFASTAFENSLSEGSETTFSCLRLHGNTLSAFYIGDGNHTLVDMTTGKTTHFSNKKSNRPIAAISSNHGVLGQPQQAFTTLQTSHAISLYSDGMLEIPEVLEEIINAVKQKRLNDIDEILNRQGSHFKDDTSIVIVVPKTL